MSNAAVVTIGCALADAGKAAGAIAALCESGVEASTIRIGAIYPEAMQSLTERFPIRAAVDPRDPLAGTPGLAGEAQKSAAIDRGAVIGAAVGALAGALLGIGPMGSFTPVAPEWRAFADAVVLFAVGAIAGGVLGGALGPQPSTHAAFRIIDRADEGAIVLVVSARADLAAAAEGALRSAGALDILRV